MYVELYQYFLLHKKLSVPGIGTFLLQRTAAVNDFLNKQISGPVYTVDFQNDTETVPSQLNYWLARRLEISEESATSRLSFFGEELKQQIDKGSKIEWQGMGTLSKGLAGKVKFVPTGHTILEAPVRAEKVIRDKAEHMVRVGEDEKSSGEMTELLQKTEKQRSFWWVYALAVAVLAFIFIAWYFSQNGFDSTAVSNTSKLVPMETNSPGIPQP